MSRLYRWYQRNQAWIVYAILFLLAVLLFLGAIFLYHFRKIWNCAFAMTLSIYLFSTTNPSFFIFMKNILKSNFFVALIMLGLLASTPSCAVFGGASGTQDYFIEAGKAFTIYNLKRLFPDAAFEQNFVQVASIFPQDEVRKVLSLKARNFLDRKSVV